MSIPVFQPQIFNKFNLIFILPNSFCLNRKAESTAKFIQDIYYDSFTNIIKNNWLFYFIL